MPRNDHRHIVADRIAAKGGSIDIEATVLDLHHDRPCRAAIARLTAEGRKLSEKLLKVSREREARLFKNFSRADREHLKALLEQLSQALADADWDH